MKIKITSTGRTRQPFILAGEKEYLSRIPGRITINELPADRPGGTSPAQVREKEADRLLATVAPGDFFIALDENGKQFSSELFAEWLQEQLNRGNSSFHFALGGAFGFDDSVRERADLVLSLSEFTFPFQLSRLILVEQLYRAVSILSGSPYHKS